MLLPRYADARAKANPPRDSMLFGKRGGQHLAAVLGAHAGTETMHLVALAFLGLIGTFHENNNSF